MMLMWIVLFFMQNEDGGVQVVKRNAVQTVVRGKGTETQGGIGNDPLVEMMAQEIVRDLFDLRFGEGVDGDTAKQVGQHAVNVATVQGAYEEDLHKMDHATAGEIMDISPKLDPSVVLNLGDLCHGEDDGCNCEDSDCGCVELSGVLQQWPEYADIQLEWGGATDADGEPIAMDTRRVKWTISALQNAAPPLPDGWETWEAPARFNWMQAEYYIAISVRTQAPEETAPVLRRVRPPYYYEYFQHEHDWCHEFHQDESGECGRRNNYLAQPLQLDVMVDDEPIVWQIDYHIGQIGAYSEESSWLRETQDTVFASYEAPTFRTNSANFEVGELPDAVRIELGCVW